MKLSKIIAGTMTWGAWGKKLDTQGMINLLNTCLENQITTFDHADIYGDHTTEKEFGTALKGSNVSRSNIQLISKCGIKYVADNGNYPIKHYSYTKKHIVTSVENSLKNLQTDYLDILLLHRPSPLMDSVEISECIESLKNQGKIIEFGVSNFTPSQVQLIERNIKVDYNQIQFSATHFDAMLDGTLDFFQTNNIIPMAWNPLGNYFKEINKQTKSLKAILSKLSEKYRVSDDILLVKWIQMHPAKILPVIGTTDEIKIKSMAKLNSFELELEEWFSIWTESMGQKVP